MSNKPNRHIHLAILRSIKVGFKFELSPLQQIWIKVMATSAYINKQKDESSVTLMLYTLYQKEHGIMSYL